VLLVLKMEAADYCDTARCKNLLLILFGLKAWKGKLISYGLKLVQAWSLTVNELRNCLYGVLLGAGVQVGVVTGAWLNVVSCKRQK
jgi:hypothetical protein